MKQDLEPSTLPPIVVRKKRGHASAHGGAWKVAYADFVTAMMSLFIVLWILAANDKVKESIAAYFQDPVAAAQKIRSGALSNKEKNDLIDRPPPPPPSNRLMKELERLKVELQRIKKIIVSIPELRELSDSVEFIITKDGLRIEMVEKSPKDGLFFALGRADLMPKARLLLAVLGREIKKLPNKVALEGHTDSRPYKGNTYSNWELSADRANAARRVLQENGVNQNQLVEVVGFADRKLKRENDPFAHQNRRVSILIKPILVSENINLDDDKLLPLDSIRAQARSEKEREQLLEPYRNFGMPLPAIEELQSGNGESRAAKEDGAEGSSTQRQDAATSLDNAVKQVDALQEELNKELDKAPDKVPDNVPDKLPDKESDKLPDKVHH
ncbi:MAG: flagellar motor protein MotB [Vulcanimicrobiota bacterium]